MNTKHHKSLKVLTVIVSLLLIFNSCKKQKTDAVQINQHAVANAGVDRLITIDCKAGSINSFELDGSGSTGNIVSYKWIAVSGPQGYSIKASNNFKTSVEIASSGQYIFELSVMDAGGLYSKDSIVITIININTEYDLNIMLNTTYNFYDNVSNPWQYATDSSDFDLTEIVGKANILPLGEFNVYVDQYADTAALSDKLYADYVQISMGQINPLYIAGNCSINFKKLIRQGGGAFSGTLTVTDGSATKCNPNIFLTLPPLLLDGNLDINTHKVSLRIRGKTFF